MRLAIPALVAVLAAASCGSVGKIGGSIAGTNPKPIDRGDYIVVFNDTGGNPFAYEAERKRLEAQPKEVRLGECNSACTFFMTMDNACLMPGYRFGFHSSNLGGSTNAVQRKYYRAGILEKFNEEWSKSTRITRITAEEAVQLDPGLRLCVGTTDTGRKPASNTLKEN